MTSSDQQLSVCWSIPAMLRKHTDGKSTVQVKISKPEFQAALQQLLAQHPDLNEHFQPDMAAPRTYLSIFHNSVQLTDFSPEVFRLRDGDELLIVSALAGG